MLRTIRHPLELVVALVILRASINCFDTMSKQWDEPKIAFEKLMVCYDLKRRRDSGRLCTWNMVSLILGGEVWFCLSKNKREDLVWTLGYGVGFWIMALCITWAGVHLLVSRVRVF
jgi:hypothetical protein